MGGFAYARLRHWVKLDIAKLIFGAQAGRVQAAFVDLGKHTLGLRVDHRYNQGFEEGRVVKPVPNLSLCLDGLTGRDGPSGSPMPAPLV